MPQGPRANDEYHAADHHDHEDADELVAAAEETAAKELGRRSFEPAALLVASRQRRIQSGLLLTRLGRVPLIAFLRLKLRFTLVLEPSQHDAVTVAFVPRCADREQSIVQFRVARSGAVGGPEFLH
jgi:hypothetical protein